MGIITVVNVVFQVYSWLLIVRILLSWIRHNPYHPIIRFIYEVTDPFLGIFKRIVPPFGQVDISPIIAFLVLDYLFRPLVTGILRLLLKSFY